MKRSAYLLGALLLGFGVAEAQKGIPSNVLTTDGQFNKEQQTLVTGTATSRAATTITLDISGTDSWDGYLDTSNDIILQAIPTGEMMTGIGWDVTITTIASGLPGGSYLSEAKIYFDGSDQDGSGLFLTPGVSMSSPGSAFFSSSGIIDLSDNGIPDIPILADGMLHMQFYESYDDAADAIDAFWVSGTLTIIHDNATPPVADFTSDVVGGGAPLTVNFSDISGGTVTSWAWDFGDGGTSTLQNPSYTYVADGLYTVTLVATGSAGTDTMVKPDYINVYCTGMAPVVNVFEDFDSGVWPPAGWTVNDLGTTGFVWDTNTVWGAANQSGGTGECAVIDSDAAGSSPHVQSEMITVAMDLPAYPVALAYNHTFQWLSSTDFGTVDINVNGGGWVNLVTYQVDTDPYPGSGSLGSVDLSAYAGATNVQFRFLYDDTNTWAWYWHVDDVGFYPLASATSRNAGTNPAAYSIISMPVMGCDYVAEVDCGTTGHTAAMLAGYNGAGSLTLPYGQVILVDLASNGEFLGFPTATGPTATFTLSVPADPIYAGLPMITQAALIGGPQFLLTNSQDLLIGFTAQ